MPTLTFVQDAEASTGHQNVFIAQVHPQIPSAKLVMIQYLGDGESTNVVLIGARQEESVGTHILWRENFTSLEDAMGAALYIGNEAIATLQELGLLPNTVEGALDYLDAHKN
jgi:hypothetical protein